MSTWTAIRLSPDSAQAPRTSTRVTRGLHGALFGSLLLHGLALAWVLRDGEVPHPVSAPLVQVAILEVPRPAPITPPEAVAVPEPESPPVAVRDDDGSPEPEPVRKKVPEPDAVPAPRPELAERNPPKVAEATPPEAAHEDVAPADPAPVAVTPPSHEADYLDNPPPAYPRLSRRLREEGEVELRVRVSPAGQAVAVELARSSGSGRLDEAALQAVRSWRFEPARRGEQPVEAWVRVPIVFRLEA